MHIPFNTDILFLGCYCVDMLTTDKCEKLYQDKVINYSHVWNGKRLETSYIVINRELVK